MASITFTEEELAMLKVVIGNLVIRRRTGEVGILHGMDRFVSTHVCLKKGDREVLYSAVTKLGLRSGVRETEK